MTHPLSRTVPAATVVAGDIILSGSGIGNTPYYQHVKSCATAMFVTEIISNDPSGLNYKHVVNTGADIVIIRGADSRNEWQSLDGMWTVIHSKNFPCEGIVASYGYNYVIDAIAHNTYTYPMGRAWFPVSSATLTRPFHRFPNQSGYYCKVRTQDLPWCHGIPPNAGSVFDMSDVKPAKANIDMSMYPHKCPKCGQSCYIGGMNNIDHMPGEACR